MFGLLGWLWERAIRLYEWFGSGYDQFVYTVKTIWGDAWDLARAAYCDAVTYILGQITWVYNTLLGMRDGLVTLITSVAAGIRAWAEAKFTEVIDYATGWYRWIIDWAVSAIQEALERAIMFSNQVRSYLLDYVTGWCWWIIEWAAPIVGLFAPLQALLTIFTEVNKARLVDFLERGYQEVFEFFESPLDFLYDKLEMTFVSFLCFVLAQALGTQERELPDKFKATGG